MSMALTRIRTILFDVRVMLNDTGYEYVKKTDEP